MFAVQGTIPRSLELEKYFEQEIGTCRMVQIRHSRTIRLVAIMARAASQLLKREAKPLAVTSEFVKDGKESWIRQDGTYNHQVNLLQMAKNTRGNIAAVPIVLCYSNTAMPDGLTCILVKKRRQVMQHNIIVQ